MKDIALYTRRWSKFKFLTNFWNSPKGIFMETTFNYEIPKVNIKVYDYEMELLPHKNTASSSLYYSCNS